MAVPLHITAALAALTTVFTPPCSTSWLVATTRLPSQLPAFPGPGPATCDPPAWSANLAGKGFQFYSPAICPDGFAVGTSCLVEAQTLTVQDFPAITDGETVAWCVPSGHTCTSDTTDFRGGIWGVSRTDTATGATVTVGPALQIRWRDADLVNLATHPLTPGLILMTPAPPPDTPPAPTTSSTAVPIPRLTGNSAATADSDRDGKAGAPSATATTALPTVTGSTTTPGAPVSRIRHSAVSSATTASSDSISDSSSSNSSSVVAGAATAATAVGAHRTKGEATPSMHRLVVALVVVSLVGVAASGLAVAFFVSVRRRQKRQSAPRDAEDQQGHPVQTAPALDSGPDSGFTAVGTGAWIRTRQSGLAWLRSRVVPAAARLQKRFRWPASSPVSLFGILGGRRSGHGSGGVLDPELEAWRRQRSTVVTVRTETRGEQAVDEDEDEDEDEEKQIRQREEALSRTQTRHKSSVDAPGGEPAVTLTVGGADNGRRTSWLERLSHFLRAPSGDGSSGDGRRSSSSRSHTDDAAEALHRRGGGGGGGGGATDRRSLATATSASRPSTTRWSRWSRWTLRSTDDGLDDGAVVVDTAVEQPIPPLPPPQRLRLLLLLPPPSPAAGRRGRLSVSPVRPGGGGGGDGDGGADSSFARLSNGTFGLVASPASERRTPLPSPGSRSSGRDDLVLCDEGKE